MLKRIKNLLEGSAFIFAIALTFLIIYLSLVSTPKIMGVVSISDKGLHLFAYFILSSSWFFAVKSSHFKIIKKVNIGLLVLVFSIILELLQGTFTNYRTADYYDIVANAFGIIIAIVSFKRMLLLYHTI